ncbi:MAG: hypothetical protein K2Y22_14525 [Candidatus Obscuribacterales bacterium]|nr:hypothetical protein [Candidatus Obscuribacterales bacterium]
MKVVELVSFDELRRLDVIMSEKFLIGMAGSDWCSKPVVGRPPEWRAGSTLVGFKKIDIRCSASQDRVTSSYVVEELTATANGSDPYFGGNGHLNVYARRLRPDGSYNPEGELITFCMNDAFDRGTPVIREVKRTGRLVPHYSFE